MRVFITWSGRNSRSVAEVIRRWLPGVLQAVKPYFSPDDVVKGSRWFPEVAKELDASAVGLLCVTRQNLNAPWLLFEAGALGKNLDKSKVCPLLFGVEPTDLTGPLSQFQGSRFQKNEFKQVVQMINTELGPSGLQSDVLDNVFEMWWPQLEQNVTENLSKADDEQEGEARSDRDILEEILQLNRSVARESRIAERGVHPAAVEDLVMSYTQLLRSCSSDPPTSDVVMGVERLRHPIEHIARMSSKTHRRRPRMAISMLEEMRTLLPIEPAGSPKQLKSTEVDRSDDGDESDED